MKPTAVPALVEQCRIVGLPAPMTELTFAKSIGRRWRFDLAWPALKLAVEIDGGGFVAGRHSRGAGLEKDCEKFAEAAIMGYTVIRCTPRQVTSGQALGWIERYIATLDTPR